MILTTKGCKVSNIPDEITADEYLALMGKGESKYGNRKVEIDGIVFDSVLEGQHYKELALLELAGEISQLELQPEFVLMPAFKRDNKTHRAVKYRADFAYVRADGQKVVVDCKGMKTPVYLLKRKLLLRILPDDVLFIEVDAGSGRGRRGRKGRR